MVTAIVTIARGLQADLEITSAAQGKSSAADALSELLGPDASEDEFWLKVKTNLEAGRIRLLFVADAIPPELRRIIEFLNKQMDPAEVLGVELRQFEGQGLRTLVPLVVGQTQEATQKRNAVRQDRRLWDEASILAEIQSGFSDAELKVARRIVEWMKGSGGRLRFSSGQRSGSMSVMFTSKDGVELCPIRLRTYGLIAIPPISNG